MPHRQIKAHVWISRFALIVFGTAVAVLLTEAAVRLFHLAPQVAMIDAYTFRLSHDPRLVYEPIPGVQRLTQHAKPNALGLRDRPRSELKPAGTARVIALGDSVTEGLYMQRFDTIYVPQLEALLTTKNRPVEVMNFGVSGYNTAQEVAYLEDYGIPYKPDLVLLQYCNNDHGIASGNIVTKMFEKESASAGVTGLHESGVWRYSAFAQLLHYNFREYWLPPKQRETLQRLTADTVVNALSDLKALSEQAKFKVLVAFPPTFADDGHTTRRPYWEKQQIAAVQAVRDLGFTVLDLRAAFDTCISASPERPALDRFHFSEAGHRCFAHAVAPAVRELLGAGTP